MPVQVSVGLTISGILILAGLVFHRSKLLYALQLLWIWILCAFNTFSADWYVHLVLYQNARFTKPTLARLLNGGWLLATIWAGFKQIGFDFVAANAVTSTIIILMIAGVIGQYTRYPCFALSLFMVFPLFNCIIQKRFFLAAVLVLWGLKFLYNEKKNYLAFCLICFGAVQIHVMTVGFFAIAIVFALKKFLTSKALITVFCSEIILINYLPLALSWFIPSGKWEHYFVTLHSYVGFWDAVLWALLYGAYLAVLLLNRKSMQDLPIDAQAKKLYIGNTSLNQFFLLVLPLFYFEPTIQRFIMYFLLMNYMEIGNLLRNRMIKNVQKAGAFRIRPNTLFFSMAQIILTAATFILTCVIFPGHMTTEDLLYPIFADNLFLNWICG